MHSCAFVLFFPSATTWGTAIFYVATFNYSFIFSSNIELAWLVEKHFSATGYVLVSDFNRLITLDNCNWLCFLSSNLSRLREDIKLFIFSTDLSDRNKAIISALTIGDKSGLGKWWGDLSRLGIVHLLVISGLHIGLVAGLGVLFGITINRILMIMTFDFRNKAIFSRFFPPLCGLLAPFFLQSASGLFSSYTARYGCGCFGYAV